MYAEALQKLEAALLRRNPGIAPALKPGLPPDSIRQQLKRVGIKTGQIDPIVELYSWHDGATGAAPGGATTTMPKQVQNLGFAPPTVTEPLRANIEFLQSLGHKIDPNFKVYGTFAFFNFESVIRSLKLWKKFRATSSQYAALFGRAVPFLIYSQTGQQLALDIDPTCNTRIIGIETDPKDETGFREAYPSFADFLNDVIRANETNQLLSWPQTPGNPIELPVVPEETTPKRSSKSKEASIAATENILALRTDFSDDAAWESLRAKLEPALSYLSDPKFNGVTPKQLPKLLPEGVSHPFAVIIDQTTFAHADHPLVIVDLQEKPGRSFRSALSAFRDVYDNLTLANMEFSEFAGAVDSEKIFRGFE